MTLDKIKVGNTCIIKKILNTSKIKRRLLDIGLESPGKDICAYLIRGSVIAIRKVDAKEVEVSLL